MLEAAVRLAAAAGIATGVGLGVRLLLLQFLPGMDLMVLIGRATVLCAIGLGIYLACARFFGIDELGKLERILLRKLKFQRSR
jgi:putative peptidoglycan lipid II flippase